MLLLGRASGGGSSGGSSTTAALLLRQVLAAAAERCGCGTASSCTTTISSSSTAAAAAAAGLAACARGSSTSAAVAAAQLQQHVPQHQVHPQPQLAVARQLQQLQLDQQQQQLLQDTAYARRLQEMLSYDQQQQQQQQRHQHPPPADQGQQPSPHLQHLQQQQQQRQRRRLDLDSIPVLDLKQASRAGNQQQQQQQEPDPSTAPAVDWRAIVEQARRTGLAVAGEQMLTDTFRRKHTYLRISLTERCNLRCTYCMPADGVELTPSQQLLAPAEVERLARLFVTAGVTKIRLTGGEPTVRRDLPEIIARLATLRPLGLRTIGLTSNGLTLAKQLPELKAAGLSTSGLNISLDSLRPERFEALTRRRGHARVLRAIDTAVDLGFDPVKVNVVVQRGVNDDEVGDFVELTRARPINVRFIEYMPFDGNVWAGSKLVPYRELMAAVAARFPNEGLVRHADPAGEVAKNFSVGGFRGSVSFVTSMTHAFCGDCNRLRLLADGALKVCLFGANEVSLRDAMRGGASDTELAAVISAAVDNKKAAHAGMEALAVTANRPMITIGG